MATDKQIVAGAFKVLLVLLLTGGAIWGAIFAFSWLGLPSTVFNAGGLVLLLVILVVYVLLFRRIIRTQQKK